MHAQTRRQSEVLDFISHYIDSHGYRPSYQVIARHLGVRSRAGIGRIVRELETQGLLTRKRENGHFYLEVKSGNGAGGSVMVDWLDIPDGSAFADPWQQQQLAVPGMMLGIYEPGRLRAFRVPDNEMAGESICEDDIALIELRQFVRDGERVVATVEDQSTVLRKYYRSGADIELRSALNGKDGEPLRLSADKVLIRGVFRGLLRPAV
jgi:SOS-response transcriptional repressor LexA